MKCHILEYLELYVILGLFLSLITLVIGIGWISPRIEAHTMRQAGYEAKAVNFDCFAKYQGRWLHCVAVAHNSVQITH